ncbi:phosphoglycerate mutase-like protein [Diplogelasinospora grovesii]|uniref:Phosphoglycerate mutase-like protein n=1 Tax=Diplogelasinospora grovesii TaxID=303347 RepID=A0AAN6S4X1_9PEZI|nr:phosphoglycerate mutase-like protein [Diplogelasinospora grovesii]
MMVQFLVNSLLLLVAAPGATLAWKAGTSGCSTYSYINYTTVTGFFLQDDPSTSPSGFDYATTNWGLINRTYPTDSKIEKCGSKTQWQKFAYYVKTLNQEADGDTAYKVFFFGRHGEGWHNAAESYYGTPAWNCYWSELEGNGTVTWADATLTPSGIAQAVKANNYWKTTLETQKVPAPESYYTSPLMRCLITANITFSGLSLPASRPFVPVIKEFFREGISIHTCDHRSNKTYIHSQFPTWGFEPSFAEHDPLWNGVTGEESSSEAARSKIVLDEVFAEDDNTWISVTSHSGEIASLLSVLRHRTFSLSTGQIIPVLVKAQRLYQAYPSTTINAWTSLATCTQPPITSIASIGCVCSGSPTATATPA